MRILEIGCGKNPFLSEKDDVTHLDRFEFPHVEILCNVEDGIPFPINSFDMIIAYHLIEHLYDPLKFLRECYRVLRMDGVIRIKCPLMEFEFANFLSLDHKHLIKENSFDDYVNQEVLHYGTRWELIEKTTTGGEIIVCLKKLKF